MTDSDSRQLPDDSNISGSDETYNVRLNNIFEGPMDLLVHLIKKAEVDIYDIPISKITDQYLNYLEWMKRMNIDFAGDFVLMASTLTQIKSRMLLPASTNEDEDDDPRLEITRPLLEYLKIKSAAEQLNERNLLGDKIFTRTPDSQSMKELNVEDNVIQVGLFELIDAFQNILDKISSDHRVNLAADKISVQERMTQITDLLETKESLTFDELLTGRPTRSDVIVTFLAILELAKLSLIRIAQHIQSGIIRIFYV